jgi:GNAT superfamily N-acetyltransferase
MLLSSGRPVANATLSLLDLAIGLESKYPTCYFNRHFVEPAYRGKHLGAFLLEKVLEFAQREALLIYNECNPYGEMSLEELTSFYVRHGFKVLKEGVFYWSPK